MRFLLGEDSCEGIEELMKVARLETGSSHSMVNGECRTETLQKDSRRVRVGIFI